MNMKFTSILVLFSCVIVSCSNDLSQRIAGEWKVTDMKAYMNNVSQQLIENAKTLSLATTYEISNNGRYSMKISETPMETGREHRGTMKIDSKSREIIFSSDTILYKKNGHWEIVEKNNYNTPMFKPMNLEVDKISSNRLILSKTDKRGTIIYILERISE